MRGRVRSFHGGFVAPMAAYMGVYAACRCGCAGCRRDWAPAPEPTAT